MTPNITLLLDIEYLHTSINPLCLHNTPEKIYIELGQGVRIEYVTCSSSSIFIDCII